MAYIGWIIAVLVLGMMAYPILQIIPGKQQKMQIAFRQAALRKGIHIQIRQPDLPPALAGQYAAISRCAAYFKAAPSSRLTATYMALRSNNGTDWFWLGDHRPPAAIMQKMLDTYGEVPGFCLAIEQGQAGSTLFLQDNLELACLEPVADSLDKLNTLISQ